MPSYDFQKPLTYLDQLNCFLQHSVVGTEKGLTGVRSAGLTTFVDYSIALSQEDYLILSSLVENFQENPPRTFRHTFVNCNRRKTDCKT